MPRGPQRGPLCKRLFAKLMRSRFGKLGFVDMRVDDVRFMLRSLGVDPEADARAVPTCALRLAQTHRILCGYPWRIVVVGEPGQQQFVDADGDRQFEACAALYRMHLPRSMQCDPWFPIEFDMGDLLEAAVARDAEMTRRRRLGLV